MADRAHNLRVLRAEGYRVASSLPLLRSEDAVVLRPAAEILGRALALRSVCFWVTSDEQVVSSERIHARITRDHLEPYLTAGDKDILTLSRAVANREHIATIGWRLENIWPLAWVLGFEQAPSLQRMIDGATINAIFAYLPKGEVSAGSFLSGATVRDVGQVDALEDLFYCAHNAARSAQLGHDTVPHGFDPIADAGVIHERRHALTWALSPGVEWDDTDLST